MSDEFSNLKRDLDADLLTARADLDALTLVCNDLQVKWNTLEAQANSATDANDLERAVSLSRGMPAASKAKLKADMKKLNAEVRLSNAESRIRRFNKYNT